MSAITVRPALRYRAALAAILLFLSVGALRAAEVPRPVQSLAASTGLKVEIKWDDPNAWIFLSAWDLNNPGNFAVGCSTCGPSGLEFPNTLANATVSNPFFDSATGLPVPPGQPITIEISPLIDGAHYYFFVIERDNYIKAPVNQVTATITLNGTTTQKSLTFTDTYINAYGEYSQTLLDVVPTGTFQFDLSAAASADDKQARLLTHAYRQDISPSRQFFSDYQLDAQHTVPANAARPQMKIDGTVSNAPARNQIWFKLIDPPDPSPYAAADSKKNDNRDTTPPKLMTADGQQSVGLNTALQTSWDSSNAVHLILEASEHVAGDNYQMIASLEAPDSSNTFPCEAGNSCSSSPVVTVWKRIYVESDSMFRAGAFLTQNIDPSSADVQVRDGSMFRQGQSVRFIHGSRLHHGIAPAGQSFGDTSFSEDATILTPLPNDPTPAVYMDGGGNWHIRLTHPLSNVFRSSEVPGVDIWADAVGVVTGNPASDFYIANESLLANYFASMYVDVVSAPQSVPEFPYIDLSASTLPQTWALLTAHLRWFQNASRGRTIDDVSADPDHMHMVAATRIRFTPNCSTNYGDTYVNSNNVSWIYERRIEEAPIPVTEAPCQGRLLPTAARDPFMVSGLTVAHELTHQWMVNHSIGYSGGHCTENGYLQNGDICLLNSSFPAGATPTQIDLGRPTLHYLDHGSNSEYISIRTTTEPIPQQ